jgi:hypothetical protein
MKFPKESVGKAAVVVIALVFFVLGLVIEVAVVIHFLKDQDGFHLLPNFFGFGSMLLAFATLLPMSLKEAGTILIELAAKLPPFKRGDSQPSPPPTGDEK